MTNRRPPMNKEWRPADWFNEYEGAYLEPEIAKIKELCFEAGASAMLEARDKDWIAWGESECPHESQEIKLTGGCYDERKFEYKLECPLCWAERKKEINP
jgi:hypothetical protein